MRGRIKTVLLGLLLAAGTALGQNCTPGGGVTCTPTLNLWLPPFNYQVWNSPLNTNFSIIDTFATSTVLFAPTATQIIAQPSGTYFEFNNAIVYNATNPYLGFSTSTPAVFQGDISMPSAGSFTLDTTAPGNAAANLKLSFVNAVSGYQVNGSGGSAGQALCSDGTYFDTTCAVGAFYQTVAANGSAQTQRPTLNFSGQFSLSDSSSPAETTVNIANSGVTAGTYTNPTIAVGTDGRVTSASNGASSALVQPLVITTGICTTPGGSPAWGTCAFAVSWPSAFADTNYSATCTVGPLTGGGGSALPVAILYITSKTTTGITIALQNGDASGATATTPTEIDCLGVHP